MSHGDSVFRGFEITEEQESKKFLYITYGRELTQVPLNIL